MITTQTVKTATGANIQVSDKMARTLVKWDAMYTNNAPWLVNGKTKSLNLPAAIAAEIARAVTIEMEVEYSGSPRADFINEMIQPVLNNIRKNIEYGCAKGGIMFKPYPTEDSVFVDYIQADRFYPVSFDANGKMTAVIFTDQKTRGNYVYTRLEFHRMNADKTYTITNQVFRSSSKEELGVKVDFASIAEWADLEPEATISGIEKPLFAYFKYPSANNVDTSSPLGVSCYARAEDLIEQADEQWYELWWEYRSGHRALYVDELAFGKHPTTGKPVLPAMNMYRTLKTAGQIGGKSEMFEDWTPTIRYLEILAGLDVILKQIEFTCGLAQGTISDPNTIALTATEIKMSKQRTYATITDTQKALENTMEDLAYAIDVFATIQGLAPKGSYAASYLFDDSIVADHDTQFTQDTSVLDRVMSRIEFRMRNYGETEEIAREKLAWLEEEETKRIAMQPDLFPADA